MRKIGKVLGGAALAGAGTLLARETVAWLLGELLNVFKGLIIGEAEGGEMSLADVPWLDLLGIALLIVGIALVFKGMRLPKEGSMASSRLVSANSGKESIRSEETPPREALPALVSGAKLMVDEGKKQIVLVASTQRRVKQLRIYVDSSYSLLVNFKPESRTLIDERAGCERNETISIPVVSSDDIGHFFGVGWTMAKRSRCWETYGRAASCSSKMMKRVNAGTILSLKLPIEYMLLKILQIGALSMLLERKTSDSRSDGRYTTLLEANRILRTWGARFRMGT